MKRMIKKVLCTSLAALTIVSSSAAINKNTSGNIFSNSIIAEAAAVIATEQIGDHDVLYKYNNFLPDRKISYRNPNTSISYWPTHINETKGNSFKTYKVEYYPKYTGNSVSIVDALKSLGIDSSKENRKRIAKRNYIEDYNFTAEQNTRMLKLLKNGILIETKK